MSGSVGRARRWASGRVGIATRRARASTWSILQMSVAAGVAWQIASAVLGHPGPFFAAIAAVVCLGLGVAHRVRRVAELAVGVTVGVALSELVVGVIGRGAWQLALVVALALGVARLLDGGALVATQAALQAVLVVSIPPSEAASAARWADAMVGGLVALVVAVLTPPDPRREPDAQCRAATAALADVLRATAAAIRHGDPDEGGHALAAARETHQLLHEWEEAVATGEEITRVSPLRRGRAGDMVARRRAFTGMDRAIRNARVLVRRVTGGLDDGREVPVPLADDLDDLAAVLDAVDGTIGARPQPELAAAAGEFGRRLDLRRAGSGTWVGATSVAQLRSMVVDVLTATGMSPKEARALLPEPRTPADGAAVDDGPEPPPRP